MGIRAWKLTTEKYEIKFIRICDPVVVFGADNPIKVINLDVLSALQMRGPA